jgi:hypothetical protein
MKAAISDAVNNSGGQGGDERSSEVPKSAQQEPRSTARKGRVVTSDESLRIAPPPVNRPLREPCGKRCATCGAMRCGKPKRR